MEVNTNFYPVFPARRNFTLVPGGLYRVISKHGPLIFYRDTPLGEDGTFIYESVVVMAIGMESHDNLFLKCLWQEKVGLLLVSFGHTPNYSLVHFESMKEDDGEKSIKSRLGASFR